MAANPRSAKPKPYHHGDLRNALIDAGLELLAAEGTEGFNLRKVAQRAGVSHAAPYRHFEDKQALIAAIAEEGFHKLVVALQEGAASVPHDARAQLHATGQAYIRFALDNPAQLRLMFSGTEVERDSYPLLYATSKQAFGLLTGLFAKGQAEGSIALANPDEQAVVIWSAIHGLATLLVEKQLASMVQDATQIPGVVHLVVETILAGMAPR